MKTIIFVMLFAFCIFQGISNAVGVKEARKIVVNPDAAKLMEEAAPPCRMCRKSGFATVRTTSDDIDKILKAKDIVRASVNFPDSLVFHEFSTKVSGNTVTLKFSCKNAFGVSETHTKDIKVN